MFVSIKDYNEEDFPSKEKQIKALKQENEDLKEIIKANYRIDVKYGLCKTADISFVDEIRDILKES